MVLPDNRILQTCKKFYIRFHHNPFSYDELSRSPSVFQVSFVGQRIACKADK